MSTKLYFLVPLLIILSTLSVFALTSDTIPAPSSSITISDINLNNSDLVLIKIKDTNSMLPTFDENNIVLGLPINNNTKLNIGDIVVYEKGNLIIDSNLIIHRIIDITEEGYLLKGDNNDFNDGFIDIADIKYKTVGIIY